MDNLSIILTRASNPASLAIRLALPHSLFALGRASHAVIVDGEHAIEARMLYRRENGRFAHGVRRVPLGQAIGGSAQIVGQINFAVPDAPAGLAWAREQVGRPYDFKGAFGLSLDPFREWQRDDAWFCFELAAATIHKAGRVVFASAGHVTGREFLIVAG